jgi:hypothetical protein
MLSNVSTTSKFCPSGEDRNSLVAPLDARVLTLRVDYELDSRLSGNDDGRTA